MPCRNSSGRGLIQDLENEDARNFELYPKNESIKYGPIPTF